MDLHEIECGQTRDGPRITSKMESVVNTARGITCINIRTAKYWHPAGLRKRSSGSDAARIRVAKQGNWFMAPQIRTLALAGACVLGAVTMARAQDNAPAPPVANLQTE